MRRKVRILRPHETSALIENIPKKEYRAVFRALLFSGMRYIELKRFQKHPSWFDGEWIHLPEESVHKHLRTQLERTVRLTPVGRLAIENFSEIKLQMPTYVSWNMNLKCWGYHAGLSQSEKTHKKKNTISAPFYKCPGLSVKTTRKTYESWLMFYYPERRFEIALSQGHTTTTSLQHYLGMPFNEHDRMDMKEFVEGW